MGGMFTQMNDSESAAKCFLQALDLEHEDPRAFSGLGVALALRGEYAGGRQCLEQSLRLHDDNPTTLLNAAWMCCRLEDWEAAGVYAARSQSLQGSREPYRSACKSIEKEVRQNSGGKTYARFLPKNVSGLIKRAGFGLFR